MSKNSFVKGAAILGAAGLIVKLLGAFFRIPLAAMLGATGMAYYTPAYNIYTVFIVIATSGIPVAISRMVSERITINNYEEAHRVFRVSFNLMLGIGVVSFIILMFGSGVIADAMKLPESKLPMMAVAPALILVPIMASYRGYFQGMQNMRPTAFSQVIEQVFRVGFGLFLAYTLYKGAESFLFLDQYSNGAKGAAGAAFGATLGSVGGLAIIIFIYIFSKKAIDRRRLKNQGENISSDKSILKEILTIAIPITIGAAVMPIMNAVEIPIIMNRLLAAGFERAVASNLYGQIGGLAMPIVNLPQVISMALAMSLVPLISSAHKEKNVEKLRYNTSLGLRLAMLVGLPCAVGIAVLAEPIMLLLFGSRAEEAISVAPTLALLSIGIIFLTIIQTVSGVLQGVGKQMVPVINLCIGIVIKIALTWILVGIPSLNIKGAAIGTAAAYLVVAVLDLRATKKYTGAHFDVGLTYIRPGISAAVMALAVWLIYYKLLSGSGGLATLIAIIVAAIVYILMLLVTKSITREDLENLPKGDKIIRLIDKIRRRR